MGEAIIPLDSIRYNRYIGRMVTQEVTTKPRKPTRRLEEEVFVEIQRAADLLGRAAEEVMRSSGLSSTQYNVLRILRGAGAAGLACGEVAERMITRDPDITRLLDRLERRGLVMRARESKDRRVITVRITPEGLRILRELDGPVADLHLRQLGHLGERRLTQLLMLLEASRETSG